MTLDFAKERAREYLRAGDYKEAMMSMMSDAHKIDGWSDGRIHVAEQLGLMMLMMDQGRPSRKTATDYVEGFR